MQTRPKKMNKRDNKISHINEETSGNGAQQLPNTDPEIEEADDWPNQGRNTNDWGSYNYYNWGVPMMFWENFPEKPEKGKRKGGNIQGNGLERKPPDHIRRGKLMPRVNGL